MLIIVGSLRNQVSSLDPDQFLYHNYCCATKPCNYKVYCSHFKTISGRLRVNDHSDTEEVYSGDEKIVADNGNEENIQRDEPEEQEDRR